MRISIFRWMMIIAITVPAIKRERNEYLEARWSIHWAMPTTAPISKVGYSRTP
ncbi:hypothetical protein D3C75_1064520 [compost metagenome]